MPTDFLVCCTFRVKSLLTHPQSLNSCKVQQQRDASTRGDGCTGGAAACLPAAFFKGRNKLISFQTVRIWRNDRAAIHNIHGAHLNDWKKRFK